MAGKFKMPSKKTNIIIIAVVAVLLIAAITGTVIFLKDRGSTEAANLDGQEVTREGTDGQEVAGNEQIPENGEEQENQNPEGELPGEGEAEAGETATTETGTTTGTGAGRGTGTTTRPGQNPDGIDETTIIEYEESDIYQTLDGRYVGWSPMEVNADNASARITATLDELQILKIAETQTGSEFATVGEEITYKITVFSEKEMKGIEIKDVIPEGTTYIKDSADNNAEIFENEKETIIKWNIDLEAGKEKVVSFKVLVNEDATGDIENCAIVNGEETNTEKTSIIESKKTSVITDANGKVAEKAKVGDIITYTILVENKGTETGTIKIKDTKLKEILENAVMEGKIKVNGEDTEYTAEDLDKGIVVQVEKAATVEFKVKVTSVNGEIENIALIGENEKPTEPDKVDTYGYIVDKELAKIEREGKEINKDLPAKINDILTYTITVKNIGSVDINNLSIDDVLPENVTPIGNVDFDNVSVKAGKEVIKEVKVKVIAISGAIENNVVVTDKDEPTDKPGEDKEITETIDLTIDKNAELVKSAENATHEGYEEIAEVGDIIKYTVTATNNGSKELKNVKVTDSKLGIEKEIDLAAGESKTPINVEYTVTADDINVEEGKVSYIYNQAIGEYIDPDDENNNTTTDDKEEVEIRDVYEYKVEYYYDGVKDDTKTFTSEAKYGDEISTYIDKNKTGYKLEKTENNPLKITEKTENNIMKVYYVKDQFEYTVEYYYDGKIDGTKTIRKFATYQDVIDYYEDKNIAGYKFDNTENLPLTISEKTENNVIKVYYVKDQFEYTVEYYYDGVKDDTKTDKFKATYQDEIKSYEDKNITGYKFDKTENLPLTITEKVEENIIKVYYVKDKFEYTVEYYYNGVKDETKTDKFIATYQDEIKSYEDKNITGYKFDKTENLPLTITEKVEENVIKVYYVKDQFEYTVEYYYDGVKDNSKTDKFAATYNAVITNYQDKNIAGYKFSKDEGCPLTISEKAENNVIKVYYEKDQFGYTIEYYYDGIKDDSKTENKTAIFEQIISEYPNKNIDGYKFDKTENLPLTISEKTENNVIKVYYIKDQFGYTIEYYYDGIKDGTKTENKTATFEQIIEEYPEKYIDGYRFDKTENLPLTITSDVANNVIKVYYVKDQFNYTIEYYYDGIKDDSKTENKTAIFEQIIDEYPDKNIAGYVLEKTENMPLKITSDATNNVIKVYYKKDQFEYKVEYYYDGIINSENTVKGKATYGDIISTYTEKNKTGYKLDKTENLPLTISEKAENNVIRVYYVKDQFEYTVEYYYDGIINGSKTHNGTATFGDIITTYQDKNISGYKLEKVENLPLTISAVPGENVIRVYYVKDQFGYTIEYYYDGIINESKTHNGTATFGDTITTYPDKNISGYKLDKTENLPLTVSEIRENNVIRVYYVKDSFAYRVEYYHDNVLTNTIPGPKVEFGQQITAVEMTKYKQPGYKVDRVDELPFTITEVTENNVIKVYYVKDKYPYEIKYYKDSIATENYIDHITGTAEFASTVTADVTKFIPEGYKFEGTVPSMVIKVEGNVINVVYVKDLTDTETLKYTIKYHQKASETATPVHVVGDDKITTENPWVGLKQTTLTYQKDVETNKYEGYHLEKIMIGTTEYTADSIPATLKDGTVIDVYYVKDIEKYTVTYFVDGKQVAYYPDINEGTTHIVKGNDEIEIIPPQDYLFTGTWTERTSKKVYAIGDSINVDRNIILDANFEKIAHSDLVKFWQNKVSSWKDFTTNLTPVMVGNSFENQIFYSKNGADTVSFTNNGGITSVDGKPSANGDIITFKVGTKHVIEENKDGLTINIEVRKGK